MRFLTVILLLSVTAPGQTVVSGKASISGNVSTGTQAGAVAGLLDDGSPHPPSDYNTFTPPAKGSTYTDSTFGTSIRRISDYADLTASLTGEYGPHSHANQDGSKYMLLDADGIGYVVVHPTTGAIVWQTGISGSSEGYWSQTDPDKFYYRTGNTVRVANINAQTTSLIATFNGTGGLPNCSSVAFGGGDADVSEDGNYLPITCDTSVGMLDLGSLATTTTYRDFAATNENFLYCRVTPDEHFLCRLNTSRTNTGTVAITNGSAAVVGTSTLFTTEVTPGAYITVSSQQREVVTVTDNTHLTTRANFTSTASGQAYTYAARMILYDKNMAFIRAIAPFGGHADVGRAIDGSEMLAIDGANNPNTPPSGCSNNGIYKILLSDASQSCMIGFPDFNLTGHLSFSNAKGHNYVLLTYYDGRLTPTVGTMMFSNLLRADWADATVWKKYYNEAILVKTDGSEIRRLANTRTRIPMSGGPGTYADYYWFSARGSLSKLISASGYPAFFEFASNMNTKVTKNLSGTVSTSNGSATITGSGTTFSGLSSGQLYVGGDVTINAVTKQVATVDSTTSATATTTWAANSGVAATGSGPRAGINAYIGSIQAPLSDVTAPTISSINSGTPGQTSATITWTTDEAATSQVEWGTSTYYGSGISAFDLTKVTSHSVGISGLTSNTTYHYRVKSRDVAGNIKVSGDNTFATAP